MPSRGLALGHGDLHALLEVAQRGELPAALVPLAVHERVRSGQEVWRVLGAVRPRPAPSEGTFPVTAGG